PPGRGHGGGSSRARRSAGARPLVVVDAAVVRAPEPPRRARRGVRLPLVGGGVGLCLRGPRHDAGDLRGPAREGRGDVQSRDLRPRRDRSPRRRVSGRGEAPMSGELSRGEPWPALPLEEWSDTCATLHLWTQIVGKIRLALSPWMNHCWQVTLYVTARGLS